MIIKFRNVSYNTLTIFVINFYKYSNISASHCIRNNLQVSKNLRTVMYSFYVRFSSRNLTNIDFHFMEVNPRKDVKINQAQIKAITRKICIWSQWKNNEVLFTMQNRRKCFMAAMKENIPLLILLKAGSPISDSRCRLLIWKITGYQDIRTTSFRLRN